MVDTGCGKTLIGADTLTQVDALLANHRRNHCVQEVDDVSWGYQRSFSRSRSPPKQVPAAVRQTAARGGVPGLSPEDVTEVTGNVYGSNDAPFNWYQVFSSSVCDHGRLKSHFDSCLFYLRDSKGDLVGVLAAHVDDTI